MHPGQHRRLRVKFAQREHDMFFALTLGPGFTETVQAKRGKTRREVTGLDVFDHAKIHQN